MKTAFPRLQLAPSLSPGVCSICGARQTGDLGFGACTSGHTLFEEQHASTIAPTDSNVVALIDYKTRHPRSANFNMAEDRRVERQLAAQGFGPLLEAMRAAVARIAPRL